MAGYYRSFTGEALKEQGRWLRGTQRRSNQECTHRIISKANICTIPGDRDDTNLYLTWSLKGHMSAVNIFN